MAIIVKKAFFILDIDGELISRERFPRRKKLSDAVIDCITFSIQWRKCRHGGSKFRINSNDGWSTVIKSSFNDLDKSEVKSIGGRFAIDSWLEDAYFNYHYRDEY